jgi:hypothetical protein
MTRLLVALALVAAVLMTAFGGVARADSVYGYAGPGAWFAAGDGRGSSYDSPCYPWINNNFAKSNTSWGLVTFIDTSGGWNYSKQAYGNIFRDLPNVAWIKKLHCKNNSSVRYQGGCFGFRREYSCV